MKNSVSPIIIEDFSESRKINHGVSLYVLSIILIVLLALAAQTLKIIANNQNKDHLQLRTHEQPQTTSPEVGN